MTHQDKLPVLAHLPRKTKAPKPARTRPDPEDLERAIAAMRAALEADLARPEPEAGPDPHTPQPDSFTPIGAPKPRWRASRTPDGVEDAGSGWAGVAAGAVAPHGPDITRDTLARRIVSVHLPDFAMERWSRWAARQPDTPPEDIAVALAVEAQHGPVIHAANRAAQTQGVRPGARVVDMRALCPDLRIEYADLAGDARALDKLMLWMRRWCPWTTTDGADGIIMDTTGSDHLWGGEAQMLRTIEEGLSSLGLSANLACAPTHGAAWALARFGPVRAICPPETLPDHIAPLPVRGLRIEADTRLLLNRLGLKTIGDLMAVPRISLARRFSRADLPKNPLMRLDQALGKLAEPVSAPDDPPRFAVQSNLAEPVQDPTPFLPDLAEALCKGLADEGFGARRVTLTVYRTDGEVRHITVATAQPTRDAAHLTRLFDGKLDSLDPGFGFDLITLAAAVAETLTTAQTRLDGQVDDGAELSKLIDRLSARLGASSIRRPQVRESHVPERAEIWPVALSASAQPAQAAPMRPVLLFEHPEEVRVVYAVPEGPPAQFVWRRVTHRVTRFVGPERIAPEWWTDIPGTRLRDYYQIENHTAQRLWLYREGLVGDGRGQTPRWFVHGVFG